MRIGVVFPQTEIGADPGAVRAYAETVAGLGFSHVLADDHVLGAVDLAGTGHRDHHPAAAADRPGGQTGCHAVEYEALGKDFTNRGRRIEEQVTLLRQLWTEQSVTFTGGFERMEGRVSWRPDGAARLAEHVGRWREAGATHVSVNTMGAGLGPVDAHLAALTQAAEALGRTA